MHPQEARRRVVEALEEVGSLVLDESIPDAELRRDIFARLPRTDMELLVEGCRHLREGDDGKCRLQLNRRPEMGFSPSESTI